MDYFDVNVVKHAEELYHHCVCEREGVTLTGRPGRQLKGHILYINHQL